MSKPYNHLVVYDGVCILCNRIVKLLLKKDKHKRLTFSTLQGLPTQIATSGLKKPFSESISFLQDGIWWQQSSAVLMVYKAMFGPYHWSQLGWLFPRVFRDFIYDIIARNRYRWFGKNKQCMLPNPELQDRFIG